MKKRILSTLLAAVMVVSALLPINAFATDGVSMYRLYNPNSGEHFYTASTGERNGLISRGWNYEGIGWTAPSQGDPVYRLYNPNAGDHHYTTSAAERNKLTSVGWRYEGIGWRSGGSVPLYRQYNPHAKAGAHNYTTSKAENDSLVRAGWRSEGVGWYGVGNSSPADANVDYYKAYSGVLAELESELEDFIQSEDRYGRGDDVSYTLYDINGDGIKELIAVFHQDPFLDTRYIYTYDGQKTKKLFENESEYSPIGIMPAGRGIVYEPGSRGGYGLVRIRWDGSKLVEDELMARGRNDLNDNDERRDALLESVRTGDAFDMYDVSDYSLLLQ